MSRSRKKVPMIKDNGKSHRYYKKQAHQAVRARVRNLLGNNTPYEDLLFPTVKGNELVNAYNICDYIMRLDLTPVVWYSWSTGERIIDEMTERDIRAYYSK